MSQGNPHTRPPLPPPRLRPTPLKPPPLPERTYNTVNLHTTTPVGTNKDACHDISFPQPISNCNPLTLFPARDHPLQPQPSLPGRDDRPIQTNKFYGNMLLGEQQNPVWSHPYSLWYTKEHKGIAINYVSNEQKVFDGDGQSSTPRYFFSPTNIKSFVFNAHDFHVQDTTTVLRLSEMDHMSCTINLSTNRQDSNLSMPIVQGMGIATAIYNNSQPRLDSMVGIKSFSQVPTTLNHYITKYSVILENNSIWTLYSISTDNSPLLLNLTNNGKTILADRSVKKCILQLAVLDTPILDDIIGNYPIGCQIKANIEQDVANYSFHYDIRTLSNYPSDPKTLIFALPHHQDYLPTDFIHSHKTNIKLDSTVSGQMQGFITDYLPMVQLPIPKHISLDEWPHHKIIDPLILAKIKHAATTEINNANICVESNLDSMYFAGKILAKYAWLLFSCNKILNDNNLIIKLLDLLIEAMNRFTKNNQKLPLVCDKTWKGLISSGDACQDFGNSFYNDHHFHYAYHIITAAIIVHIEKSIYGSSDWYTENKDWVECLIRDYANNSTSDTFFPQFRSFDWFNGHSWAKGLFESGDGKDQESSSEDVNASYALKIWGDVTNNENLSRIGLLQLSILKSSINHYFLYSSDNITEPENFTPNKVSGILFENKIDHATYFGNNTEYIHMIHAIPIIPVTSFIRSSKFVQEEWDEKLANIVDSIQDGWKGLIMLNLAICDPKLSYEFFANTNFNPNHLDPGQSLTWSLVYAASML